MPSRNLKAIALAINCLSKIGKELLIDVSKVDDERALHFSKPRMKHTALLQMIIFIDIGTLNDSKSAFCSFRFDREFFDSGLFCFRCAGFNN